MIGKEKRNIRLQPLNIAMLLMAITLSIVLLFALFETRTSYNSMQESMDRFLMCQNSADTMQEGSDYLTLQVRSYVVTGNPDDMTNYFNESRHTRRRDRALEEMGEYFGGTEAYSALERALKESNELMETEYIAMKLVMLAHGGDISQAPREIQEQELTDEMLALSPDDKIDRARELVFGEAYQDKKAAIEREVTACLESLLGELSAESSQNSERLSRAINRQYVLIIFLVIIVLAIVILISRLIIQPLRKSVSFIRDNQLIPEEGSYEMQYLARTYNHIFEKTKNYQEQLSYEANHDPLTGLFNRGVFEDVKDAMGDGDSALILIDLDHFKTFNDNYGHEMGDKVLKRLADTLLGTFRSDDYVCRIGGDEFAVFMVNANKSMTDLISFKAGKIRSAVRDDKDGIPGFTLSMGIAFSEDASDGEELYRNADSALYDVKEAGRDSFGFYGK